MEPSQLVGLLALFAGLTIFFLLYAIYAPIVERKDETKGYREGILDDEETTEPEVDPNDSIGRYVRPILKKFLPLLPHFPLSECRR